MLFLPECCAFIGLNREEVCHTAPARLPRPPGACRFHRRDPLFVSQQGVPGARARAHRAPPGRPGCRGASGSAWAGFQGTPATAARRRRRARARPQTLAAAQPLDGPLMARYRGLARELGLWLSLGGFQERGPDAEHTHNTHVVLDAAGATVAAYRKARAPGPAALPGVCRRQGLPPGSAARVCRRLQVLPLPGSAARVCRLLQGLPPSLLHEGCRCGATPGRRLLVFLGVVWC